MRCVGQERQGGAGLEMLLEWVGTVLLLVILFLVVPICFMAVVTLQFRLMERTRSRTADTLDRTDHHPHDASP